MSINSVIKMRRVVVTRQLSHTKKFENEWKKNLIQITIIRAEIIIS